MSYNNSYINVRRQFESMRCNRAKCSKNCGEACTEWNYNTHKFCEKNCPSVGLFTTNPKWPYPSSNLSRRCGTPATNRRSYGKALISNLLYGTEPFSRALQPLKCFPVLYGTSRSITGFTVALYWSLSWIKPIYSISSHPVSPRSILTLSTHLYLGIFPSVFPTNKLLSPIRGTWTDHLILPGSTIIIMLGEEYETQRSSLCSFLQPPVTWWSDFGHRILFTPNMAFSWNAAWMKEMMNTWIILLGEGDVRKSQDLSIDGISQSY
jgi:hypothetical protein